MWSFVNKLRLIWRHTKQIIAINIRVRLSSIVGHVKGTLSLAIQFATTLQSRITSSHISSAQGQVELLKYHHHHQHWRWNLYEIYLCHIQLDSTSTLWRRDTPHMWESAVSFIHMSNIISQFTDPRLSRQITTFTITFYFFECSWYYSSFLYLRNEAIIARALWSSVTSEKYEFNDEEWMI